MRLYLKVVENSTLKKKPADSTSLLDDEKESISFGEYELHSWSDFDEDESHWRVAFLDDSFKGTNTWLVFAGHAEIWKNETMLRPVFPASSTLLKDYMACGTAGLNGLDKQIIALANEISPGSLVDFSDLNVAVNGPEVHPFLQSEAKKALQNATQEGGRRLQLSSGYRTIAQQLLLFEQKKASRCNRGAVAFPGHSRHQSGLAIDTPDWKFWKSILPKHNWKWFGPGDEVHFDFIGRSIDLRPIAVKAFQKLWNRHNLTDQIAEDGLIVNEKSETYKRLLRSPIEGFGTSLNGFRGLRLTEPPFMRGEDIHKVQEVLIQAGFDVGSAGVDAQFGPSTFAAVKKFQESNHLLADGIVGSVTLRKLGISKP